MVIGVGGMVDDDGDRVRGMVDGDGVDGGVVVVVVGGGGVCCLSTCVRL